MDRCKHLRRVRLMKTYLLPIPYLALGLHAGLRGPTLLDFTELLQCSVAAISSALMFYPIGILVGSVSGAFLTDKLTHLADLMLAMLCTLMAICYASMPWCPSLWVLRAVNLVSGFGQGNLNVACSSLTMRVWGKKAATPIHALHAFHSVGMLIGTPLAGLFLSTNNTKLMDNNITHDESLWHHNGTSTMIAVPYGIVGCMTLVAALIFAIFHCFGWTFSSLMSREEEQEDQTDSNSNTSPKRRTNQTKSNLISNTNKLLKALFTICIFIISISIMCRDSPINLFLFTIGHKSHLHMSKSLASVMTTTYYASSTLGRLVSILCARYVKIHILFFAELAVCLLLCTLMTVFALDSVLNLWLLSCLLSFMNAPTYPTAMAWYNQYLIPSGIVVAVIDIGTGAGNFSATWIGGLLFDNFGAQAVFYMSLSFSIFIITITLPLQIYAHLSVKENERQNAGIQSSSLMNEEPNETKRL